MNRKLIFRIGFAIAIVAAIFIVKEILKEPFKYAGTIEATRIDLPARTTSVVNEILVQEGDEVQKDQLLAKLSCEEIFLQHELATEKYNRAFNLRKTNSISEETFDNVENKKLEADTRKNWCEVKSPVNGIVLTRFLEPKEWVNPGTKVITVANLNKLWAYFYVPQAIMSRLKVGSKVIGNVPEINKSYTGVIVKINDEAEFTPKNVQTQSERTRLIFGIKVLFTNVDHTLKPGVTIESNLEQQST